jgi:DNA-binding NtrC family response regulator
MRNRSSNANRHGRPSLAPGGLGGKDAFRQLEALDPDVRAIVSSGYSNDPLMANYARCGFCGAVKKPYLVQEMSRVLNEVIKG